MDMKKAVVISLGGSLIVPNGGVDNVFVSSFEKFIRARVKSGWKFFVVVGGGYTARHYIEAALKIRGKISDWDLDWLGIHATRLNAHLVKTVFSDIAHPRVIANYDKKIKNLKEPLVVASGWKPGCSTDYDATYLAKLYGLKILINMSNIKYVYDRDPNKEKGAKPLKKISWQDFTKLVGNKWTPGANLPFDPIATKLASKLDMSVYVAGKDLLNIGSLLDGKIFEGTLISS